MSAMEYLTEGIKLIEKIHGARFRQLQIGDGMEPGITDRPDQPGD